MLSISKCLDTRPMPTYRKMNVKFDSKVRNVSYLDMMNSQKAIGCMKVKTRLCIAEMSVSMNNPMTLLLKANLSRTPIGQSQLIAMKPKMKITIMNIPLVSSHHSHRQTHHN